jgi:hypothetical protein
MPDNNARELYILIKNILSADDESETDGLVAKLDSLMDKEVMTADSYKQVFSLMYMAYKAYVSLPLRKDKLDLAEYLGLCKNIRAEIDTCRTLCHSENMDPEIASALQEDPELPEKILKNVVRAEMPRLIALNALLDEGNTVFSSSPGIEPFRRHMPLLKEALESIPVSTDRFARDLKEVCVKCFNILNRCFSELELCLSKDKEDTAARKELLGIFKKELYTLVPLVNEKFPPKQEVSPVKNNVEDKAKSTQSPPPLYSASKAYTPATFSPAPPPAARQKAQHHKRTCAIM